MAASRFQAAVPFSRVLRDELEEIRAARRRRGITQDLPHDGDSRSQARRGELFGLAFSGGGIRSATFNLGVLQGLAEYKLLPHLDYLSTVSGGGYIGAWFISLLKKNDTPEQVERLQQTLSPSHSHHPEAPDQEPIEFLRQYSNYLTPRLGFYSADVWTMIATWSRNFTLNLLLLVSFIGTLLILPRLLGLWFTFYWVSIGPAANSWLALPSDRLDAVISLVLLTFTGGMLSLSLWHPSDWWKFRQRGVQCGVVLPLFLGTLFLARWLRFDSAFFHRACWLQSICWPWCYFSLVFLLIALASGLWSCFKSEHLNSPSKELYAFLLLLLAGAVPSFVTALMLWGAAYAVQHIAGPQLPWALVTWGPPGLVLLLSLGLVLLVGIFGRDIEAQAREWLGRLRAWTLIYSVSWIIIFAGSIYGPLLVLHMFNAYPKTASGLSLGWIATTIAGVLSGKSAATNGNPGTPKATNGKLDLVAKIAPFVFMAGFVLLLSSGIHRVLTVDLFKPQPDTPTAQPFGLIVATGTQDVSIDVNNSHAEARFPVLAEMERDHFWLLSCSVAHLAGWRSEATFIAQPINLLVVLSS